MDSEAASESQRLRSNQLNSTPNDVPSSTPENVAENHEEGGLDCRASSPWGRSSTPVQQDGDPQSHRGVGGGGERATSYSPRCPSDREPALDQESGSSESQEVRAGQVLLGEAEHDPDRQSGLLFVGDDYCQGKCSGCLATAASIREVSGPEPTQRGHAEGTAYYDIATEDDLASQEFHRELLEPERHDEGDGGVGTHAPGGGQDPQGGARGRTTSQEEQRGVRHGGTFGLLDGEALVSGEAQVNVSGDPPEYEDSPSELGDEGSPELKALPLAAARHLEDQSHAIGPLLFETLCEDQRPLLMEVACSPESLLSKSVMEVTGRRLAATRCGLFNACDLSTPEGVRHVLRRIRTEGPRNVWISPPCGPYSPMQHANQRTESQKQELQTKRREAQAIYAGTAVVVHFCKQLGIHVTVEMSERCLAWRLGVFLPVTRDWPRRCIYLVAVILPMNMPSAKEG